MLCPVCKVTLRLSERQGIEIDYCEQCRGIWLDRGELDKLIERSEREPVAEVRSVTAQSPRNDLPVREDRTFREGYRHEHDPYHRKRKRSFLSDLLDFD